MLLLFDFSKINVFLIVYLVKEKVIHLTTRGLYMDGNV